jgi:septal ring factor EnvC (AmiA/AmiB activator)
MSKEEQSVYLASLKEYRDWYAVLTTAEDKGYNKAKEKIKELTKEKENALKEKENERKEKENALKEKENERKEKENALKEKENALKKIRKSILKLYKKGYTIEELSEDFDLSIEDINKIISG